MTQRTASRLAWSLCAFAVLTAAGALVFLALSWSTPPPAGAFGFRGFAVTFGIVGAVVASRASRAGVRP